jgi:hypothetical protein
LRSTLCKSAASIGPHRITVALGPKREALRALEPRQIVPASEAPDPPEAEVAEEREDEIEQVRALHAKVIALDDGRPPR